MRTPLGELLVQAGLVAPTVLETALRDQEADGRRLGELLIARGIVTDTQVTQILSHQLSLPWVALAKVTPDPMLLTLLPKPVAVRLHIVPLYVRRDRKKSAFLYVATDDPTHEAALRECAEATRMEVRPMVAASSDLRNAIDAWYGGGRPAATQGAPSGAVRVAASVVPSPPERKTPLVPKPGAIPPPRAPKIEELELDDEALVPRMSSPPPDARTRPVVLVVGGRSTFAKKVRQAADVVNADVERSDLGTAGVRVKELSPVAIVVTEDVYAFDRLGITKLSVDGDALLVIWSDELEPEYLEPLIDTAIKRRPR